MTGIAFHNPAGLHDPAPFGYSHVARVPAGHDLLFVAGQGGFGPDLSMSSGFRGQMRQAIANLAIALTANGATLADVVRTTLLIVDYGPDVFAIMAEELALAWPDTKPASTLIPVERLALPGMLIEIEATAALAVQI